MSYVSAGNRLGRAKLCPDDVYEKLLLSCWADTPKNRPSFAKISDMWDGYNSPLSVRFKICVISLVASM